MQQRNFDKRLFSSTGPFMDEKLQTDVLVKQATFSRGKITKNKAKPTRNCESIS